MDFSDILSLCISILGLYGLIYYLRFLIPRNVLPSASVVLTEAEHLLDRAESTGVVPQENDYRSALTSCANEFLQIRMESHRAPGILRQLQLAVWYCLTYRLYTLSSKINAIKIKIELAMDERRLTSFSINKKSTTVPTQPEPTPVGNMRLTRYGVERYIVAIVAAMVMTNIVERISHWRQRQTLLPKCSEPVDFLSSSHVLCSSDLTTSHCALETRPDGRCYLIPIETWQTLSDHHDVLSC